MTKVHIVAVQTMLEEAARMFPKETGGILMGTKSKEGGHILQAIGPGPKAIHKEFSFKPDDDFHEKQMASVFNSTNGTVTYLGEWHTHPTSAAYLSDRDKKTLKDIAFYKPSQLPQPLMLIIGFRPFQIRLWQYTEKRIFTHTCYKELYFSIT